MQSRKSFMVKKKGGRTKKSGSENHPLTKQRYQQTPLLYQDLFDTTVTVAYDIEAFLYFVLLSSIHRENL